MNVNYEVGIYPALHENMVAIIYEVGVAGTVSEVDRLIILERDGTGTPSVGAGHQVPMAVSFNGLDKVTHEVRLYSEISVALLHKYQLQPTRDTVTVFTPIRFVIGDGGANTPAAGSNSYNNPALSGVLPSEYLAFRNGVGFAFEGVTIADNGSGFDLFQSGDVFSGDPAEQWIIIQQPQVVKDFVNDSVVGKQWGPTAGNNDMFVDVTALVNYDATIHLRKLIRMSGPAAEFHFQTDSPIGYPFRFTNVGAYGALTDKPKIYFDNAGLIEGNGTIAVFEMPVGTVCEFTFDGTSWNKTILNIGTPAPVTTLKVLGKGLLEIGDIPPTGIWEIVHNLAIVGDYLVFISVQSRNSDDRSKDFKVATGWYHSETDKPNRFFFGASELVGVRQNLALAWVIIQ